MWSTAFLPSPPSSKALFLSHLLQDLGRARLWRSGSTLVRSIGLCFLRSRKFDHHTQSPANLVSSLWGFLFRRLVYGINTPRHALRFPACISALWPGPIHIDASMLPPLLSGLLRRQVRGLDILPICVSFIAAVLASTLERISTRFSAKCCTEKAPPKSLGQDLLNWQGCIAR